MDVVIIARCDRRHAVLDAQFLKCGCELFDEGVAIDRLRSELICLQLHLIVVELLGYVNSRLASELTWMMLKNELRQKFDPLLGVWRDEPVGRHCGWPNACWVVAVFAGAKMRLKTNVLCNDEESVEHEGEGEGVTAQRRKRVFARASGARWQIPPSRQTRRGLLARYWLAPMQEPKPASGTTPRDCSVLDERKMMAMRTAEMHGR